MITIYHDSFKVLETSKVRVGASILLDKDVETNGEIGRTTIKAGNLLLEVLKPD